MPNLESMIGGVDLSFTANFIIVDCDIIDEDERHDIALLKLKKNPFRGEVRSHLKLTPESEEMSPLFGIPRFNPKRPKDGTSIAISGYPLGENVLITNAGYIASSWSTDVQKIRPPGAPSGFLIPDITDIYLADVEINPGNSGGPVYTIQNLPMVIGMCVASKPRLVTIRDDKGKPAKIVGKYLLYSSGLTVVIPIRFVIDLIQINDVNWSEN